MPRAIEAGPRPTVGSAQRPEEGAGDWPRACAVVVPSPRHQVDFPLAMSASNSTDTFRIHRATPETAVAEALADVLMDCVEGGASVGFMHPLPRARALAFWQQVLASAARAERIVLVAEDVESSSLVGTVQVVLAMPDNQPHRADVAKMLVHRRARRRGLGAALVQAAETAAHDAGKTLLVLDTVTGSDAERMYARLGWERCGVIPGYALWPHGGLCSTTVFYRVLAS